MTSLHNLPLFLTYFGASLLLLAAFLVLYTWVTPIAEFTLIRQGNRAAALTLSGAILGFTLPLATAVFRSEGLADMVVWAVIALLLQLTCFFVVHLLRREAVSAIAGGDMAEATLMATGSVTLGMLNAACLV